jgi:tRNA/rRNA methyltransferase
MLGRCRVVLVGTQFEGNLGAVARVMRNFGLSDLRLVAPEADPRSAEAHRLATQGASVLDTARVVPDLGDAVADCVLVVGTSAKTGGPFRRQPARPAWEVIPLVLEALASGPAALVFGPERTGLTNEQLTRCHYLLTIPADEGYPSLNLAQAVAVCLYELRKAWLLAAGPPPARDIAPHELQERVFENLRQALTEIHFLWGDNAERLQHALRHLLGRANPSPTEADILLGVARQILWYARRHGQAGPDLSDRGS